MDGLAYLCYNIHASTNCRGIWNQQGGPYNEQLRLDFGRHRRGAPDRHDRPLLRGQPRLACHRPHDWHLPPLVFTSGQDTTQPKDTHSYTTAGALAELQGRKFEVDVTSIKPVPDSKDTWTVDVTKYEGDPCKATVEVEGSYGQYLIFFGGCEA